MANTPSSESKEQTAEPPAPEVLKPQAEVVDAPTTETAAGNPATRASKRPRRATYRPSHKATFIGLAVIIAVLAVNAGIITFVIKRQTKTTSQTSQESVTLSPAVLDKLGVSRNTVGSSGMELVVGPNARFNGTVKVNGEVSIAGELKLNSKVTAQDASLAQLQAGKTSLASLEVNGDATITSLNLRKDLLVTGLTRLQGAVTVSQLFTVDNNVNISGNLAVGGALSVNTLHVGSFVSDTTLTVGGHIITRGPAPSATPGGPALGSNGTTSISGNDTSGTVAVSFGAGAASSGLIANIAFRTPYGTIPHVVITMVGGGGGGGSVYVNRSSSGFSIGVNGSSPAPGAYAAFDYIVMQ